MNIIEID